MCIRDRFYFSFTHIYVTIQTLSNGRVLSLKANVSPSDAEYVKFDDIKDYLDLVVEKRLTEFNEQVI